MNTEFKYFVSYKFYGPKKEGFGNIEYTLTRKMDLDLIREIEKDLNTQKDVGKCIVLFYTLMDQTSIDDECTSNN